MSVETPIDEMEQVPRREVDVTLHATNLSNPSHMEWTHDGRLLATERTNGRIVDVTEGGDFGGLSADDSRVFTSGLEGPSSMAMLPDGRILSNECWEGRIRNITGGGDFSSVTEGSVFASDLDGPYSILYHDATDSVYTTVNPGNNRSSRIIDVTGGDNAEEHEVIVDQIPVRDKFPGMTPQRAWPDDWQKYQIDCGKWVVGAGDSLLYSVGPLGQVVRADMDPDSDTTTHMDHVNDERLVAEGLGRAGGSTYSRKDSLMYVAEPFNGSVAAVDPHDSRQYRFAPRVVNGFNLPTCVRCGPDGDSMFVCGRGEGVVYKVENFRP
jgi:hypothetical protein